MNPYTFTNATLVCLLIWLTVFMYFTRDERRMCETNYSTATCLEIVR